MPAAAVIREIVTIVTPPLVTTTGTGTGKGILALREMSQDRATGMIVMSAEIESVLSDRDALTLPHHLLVALCMKMDIETIVVTATESAQIVVEVEVDLAHLGRK
jgi:hypothetical protein